MTPIFYIKGGDLSFADKSVLENLELYISKGDRVCLVGRNGCGKSSLMKIIEGEYELEVGGWRHIIASLHLLLILLTHLPDALMEVFAHQDTSSSGVRLHLHLLQEPRGDLLQGVHRPLREPVYGAAVDQAREHP